MGSDGLCPLYVFVPFTVGTDEGYEAAYDGEAGGSINFGLSHTAAALLAVKHFNERDASVVPQLRNNNNNVMNDCPVQFDTEKLMVFDTETYTHQAVKSLVQHEIPCAVVGPFHDIPALDLAGLSVAYEFPVTLHRSFNLRATAKYASPYATQLYPDLVSSAEILRDFLIKKSRTDYVAFVYGLTELGTQINEALSAVFDDEPNLLNHNRGFAYNSDFFSPATSESREIKTVLRAVQKSGYRTIILNMEVPREDLEMIAQAAVELSMVGDYVYIIFGNFDPSLANSKNHFVQEFLVGVQWLQPLDRFWFDGWFGPDRFLRAWKNQTAEDVQRLRAANPIQFGKPGYFEVEDGIFKNYTPEYASGFMYDAVIATGIGLCTAWREYGSNASIDAQVQGIRSADFTGASGNVRFCNYDCSLDSNNIREPYSVFWAVVNFLGGGEYILTDIDMEDTGYIKIADTVYAGGTLAPPKLRDEPEQNFLNRGIRIFGFALMSCALLVAVISGCWTFSNRLHRMVRASQPLLLYPICLGSAMQASAIFPMSFDENQGWSESQMTSSCSAVLWMFCLGYIVTYSALFGKVCTQYCTF